MFFGIAMLVFAKRVRGCEVVCEDRDGLHMYKGKAVFGVIGYPAKCMECGAPIPQLLRQDLAPPLERPR